MQIINYFYEQVDIQKIATGMGSEIPFNLTNFATQYSLKVSGINQPLHLSKNILHYNQLNWLLAYVLMQDGKHF